MVHVNITLKRLKLNTNGEIVMAWVAVDKIGEELISRTEPFRVGDYWIGDSIFHLPKGSIKKLIGRELTSEDEPVELK